MKALYFFIAAIATTMGSLTGMGGGIIIKPVLDLLGHYNAETINFLSLVTVFSMAVVSIIKQRAANNAAIEKKFGLCLAAGAVTGGYLGQIMFQKLLGFYGGNNPVKMIQNIILAVIIVGIYIYMKHKETWGAIGLKSNLGAVAAGCCLGILSSFLGIGGGPLNVAVLVFFFSLDVKSAAAYSILTILFTQLSKLVIILFTAEVSAYDLQVLPYMVAGAILGGYLGSCLSRKFSEKKLVWCFNAVQIVVLMICIINIVTSLHNC